MAEECYKIPANPSYSLDNIRKLQNRDPVNAETVVNPLVMRILENIAAVRKDAALGVVAEEEVREMIDGTYVPGKDDGEDDDDTADNSDIQPIVDDLYKVPAPPAVDDGDDETASGEDLLEILNGLYT